MESFGRIIAAHRKEKKMSQIELAAALTNYGVTVRNTAVSSWEKNTSLPNVVQFLALCKILDITDIYNEFIGYCREKDPLAGLNEEGRERALEYISLLESSDKYRKEETTVIPFIREIKLFDLPASAGRGEFLDSDDYTMIEVGPEVPPSAEFGVRIKGNSMEPRFIDGQIVFVQPTRQVENGEIGIFYHNGNAYCKKMMSTKDGNYLISLNKEYDPIRVRKQDSFLVFGKVVG